MRVTDLTPLARGGGASHAAPARTRAGCGLARALMYEITESRLTITRPHVRCIAPFAAHGVNFYRYIHILVPSGPGWTHVARWRRAHLFIYIYFEASTSGWGFNWRLCGKLPIRSHR